MATGDVHHIVGGLKPARTALKFSAVADAQLAIDAFAVTRFAANDLQGTFTAWICPMDITGDYAIVSCGDTAVANEYICLSIKAGKLRIQCFDATTEQYDHASTAIVCVPHKWMHVAVTQNTDDNPPRLYVNGVRVPTTMTDETDNGTWFSDLDLVDDGSIGGEESAGAAGVVKEFKGGISDVKYWKVELTDEEVFEDYKGKDPTRIRLSGGVSDLTDHWDFSLTEAAVVKNVVTAANDGVITGALLQNSYSEFTSRLGFQVVAVVADSINLAVDDEVGHAVVIVA